METKSLLKDDPAKMANINYRVTKMTDQEGQTATRVIHKL